MTIPVFNDSAPNFASIAYVISRARELTASDGTVHAHEISTGGSNTPERRCRRTEITR